MLKNLHDDIKFENISGGQLSLSVNGIEELKKQAVATKEYFNKREQKIEEIKFKGDIIEVRILFVGVLAKDLPNGLKSGDSLKVQGKSIFRFRDEKIIFIQDIS